MGRRDMGYADIGVWLPPILAKSGALGGAVVSAGATVAPEAVSPSTGWAGLVVSLAGIVVAAWLRSQDKQVASLQTDYRRLESLYTIAQRDAEVARQDGVRARDNAHKANEASQQLQARLDDLLAEMGKAHADRAAITKEQARQGERIATVEGQQQQPTLPPVIEMRLTGPGGSHSGD